MGTEERAKNKKEDPAGSSVILLLVDVFSNHSFKSAAKSIDIRRYFVFVLNNITDDTARQRLDEEIFFLAAVKPAVAFLIKKHAHVLSGFSDHQRFDIGSVLRIQSFFH